MKPENELFNFNQWIAFRAAEEKDGRKLMQEICGIPDIVRGDEKPISRQTIAQRVKLQSIPDNVWRRAIASGAITPPLVPAYGHEPWLYAVGLCLLCLVGFWAGLGCGFGRV